MTDADKLRLLRNQLIQLANAAASLYGSTASVNGEATQTHRAAVNAELMQTEHVLKEAE